jgi:hypothetical protein
MVGKSNVIVFGHRARRWGNFHVSRILETSKRSEKLNGNAESRLRGFFFVMFANFG